MSSSYGFRAIGPHEVGRPFGPSGDPGVGSLGGVLRRRRWLILGALATVVTAAAVLTLVWPPTYESVATVLVERREGVGGQLPGLTILDRVERTGSLETEIELIQSRRVVRAALDSLGLDRAEAREADIPLEESRRRAVSAARERVSAAPATRDGDVIEVRCREPEPAAAQALCAAVTLSYVRLRSELQNSEASATAEFLRDQVAEYGERLATAEDSLETFARERQGVALGQQASEEVRNLAQVRAQRDQLEAERRALANVLRRVESGSDGARRYRELASFPALFQNPAVSQLLTLQAELENRRSELAQRRTELNPELAALDRRIADIDHQLAGMARSYERSLASQVASLDEVVGGSAGRLTGFPERQVEMMRLERQVASLGEMYGLLETRLREAEVAEAVNQPRVQIVDPASWPLEPSSPRPRLNLALAVVLGLAFGLALALVVEHADRRIHDRGDVERRTGLPVVGMIPQVKPAGPVLLVRAVVGDQGTARPRLTAGEGRGLLPARRSRPARAAYNGRGVAVDAFRSLGSDLQAIGRRLEKGEIRSLAITSPGRGDGKTFVACNLALTRAGFGVHTLLIDADMRAGGAARFFGLEPSPGLHEVLAGTASARDARRVVRVNDADTLSVMPSGAPTPDAAELLQTSYFEAMLAGAQAVYDLVVIDTPPLNILPDTAAIAANVDGVLVVVREDMTDGLALELTIERLDRAGGPVIGVVFNDVTLPRQYAYGSEAYSDA